MVTRNDDPPAEQYNAVELNISGRWWAWDEDGRVYEYTGDCAERDDGYVLRGELHWDPAPADDCWRTALVRYVQQLEQEGGRRG